MAEETEDRMSVENATFNSDDEYFIGNGINPEVNIDHDNLDSRLNLELG